MKKLENNLIVSKQTTPLLSNLRKELSKQTKPAKLLALRRSLARRANKTALTPGMHSAGEFRQASSMGLSDKFPFGKHKDRTIRWIIKNEPMWLVWILDNTEAKLCFNEDVTKQLALYTALPTDEPTDGDSFEPVRGDEYNLND